jgi:tetratricopeptide (TPR) repeat protein
VAECGEDEALRNAHAAYFLRLAEEAAPHLRGAAQIESADRIEQDYDNFRAALAWAHDRAAGTGTVSEGNEVELRLAGALFWFWIMRAYLSEGRHWLEGALTQARIPGANAARAQALFGAGILAQVQGDIVAARGWLEESAALWRELGDQRGLALVLTYPEGLGWVMLYERQVAAARALFAEGVKLGREIGDRWGLAAALWGLGAAVRRDDPTAARPLVEESVRLWREVGDRRGLAYALLQVGTIARAGGNPAQAEAALEESIAFSRELGDKNLLSATLECLGDVARDKGDTPRAARLYQEGLGLAWHIQDRATLAQDLVGIAGLANAARQPEQAVQLLSAADTLLHTIGLGVSVWPECRTDYDRSMAAARTQLDDATYIAAYAAGRALVLDQVIAMGRDVCAALTKPEPSHLPK